MKSRRSLNRTLKGVSRRVYFEIEQLAEILPQRVGEILEQIQSGKFDVHLDHFARSLLVGLLHAWRHFVGFAVTPTNFAVAVSDNDHGSKAKATTTKHGPAVQARNMKSSLYR